MQPVRERHKCLDFQRFGTHVWLKAEFQKDAVDGFSIQPAFEE